MIAPAACPGPIGAQYCRMLRKLGRFLFIYLGFAFVITMADLAARGGVLTFGGDLAVRFLVSCIAALLFLATGSLLIKGVTGSADIVEKVRAQRIRKIVERIDDRSPGQVSLSDNAAATAGLSKPDDDASLSLVQVDDR